jgi:CRISPR/Cas system-associated exonuclease Cas4 (RecB family)
MVAWSYSSIKTFEQCPKKYYHLKVAKDFKDADSTATIYGKELHLAAEEYIRDGKPIPTRFSFIQDVLDSLNAIPGEKFCEQKLGIGKQAEGDYYPCDFFAPDVWWRGIADLLVINGDEAFLVDYKTGKSAKYADMKQLDLLAAATFLHHPGVKRIKSALLFVVSSEFVHKTHDAGLTNSYIASFLQELERLDGAISSGVWNANAGPLCAYCPVATCEHNRRK